MIYFLFNQDTFNIDTCVLLHCYVNIPFWSGGIREKNVKQKLVKFWYRLCKMCFKIYKLVIIIFHSLILTF